MRRRRLVALVLVALFIGMPLLEIYVLVQVGQVIGAWWTILLLLLDSILGTMVETAAAARFSTPTLDTVYALARMRAAALGLYPA